MSSYFEREKVKTMKMTIVMFEKMICFMRLIMKDIKSQVVYIVQGTTRMPRRMSMFIISKCHIEIGMNIKLKSKISVASFCCKEVYGRWNGLPASCEATSHTIIWRIQIVHDQIERPPILYLLSFLSFIYI